MKFTSSLIVLGSMAGLAEAVQLEARAAQSQAVCQASFSWMQNTKKVSPCQVAASVDAVCNNGNWVIGALNSSVKYALPSGPTASFCTCSWASYNLLSACIACQGFPEQTPEWTAYSVGCPGLTTQNFFPTNITLGQDVAIPFWAQKDPTSWSAQTFNAGDAQNIASQGKPDFIGGTTTATPKKKSNVGAIVGGVIGGLLVIAAAAAVALYMIRRQRRAGQARLGPVYEKPVHMRSLSDGSTFKSPDTNRFTSITHPTSPSIMTRNQSVNSVPYTASVIRGPSTVAYGARSPSPNPPPINNRLENHIVPFTSPPTMDSNMDRKQANGTFVTYDPPNAPPPNAHMLVDINRPSTPTARRFNPPAYTESSPGGSSSGQSPPHRPKQGSIDSTAHSLNSSRSGERLASGHSPNTSISSDMPNITGQMGAMHPTVHNIPEETVPPQGHGRQVSASRDEKHRPTNSINASDLA